MKKIIYDSIQDISKFIALKLVAISYGKKGNVNIALSGGNTPKVIFQYIAKSNKRYSIDWSRLHFWWCDERHVDSNSPESNYGEARRILFNYTDINSQNLHRIDTTISPRKGALSYEKLLKEHLSIQNNLPCFDWILLGMGNDGHTASLFPDGVPFYSTDWTAVAEHPVSKQPRITLTLCVLNNAKSIDLVVTGQSKAKILQKVLEDRSQSINYPAKLLKPIKSNLIWHLDEQVAKYLKQL